MKRTLIGLTAVLVAALLAAPAGAQSPAEVTLVHGIPDLTADVWFNGELTVSNFEPMDITEPISLAAGDYEVEIRPAGASPESDPVVVETVTVADDMNASIVAHLDPDGNPALDVYANDTSDIAPGSTRLVARHTAAAPPVDVLAGGDAVVTNLANPGESGAEVPAGDYQVAVAATGSTDPLIGPLDLTLDAGTGYYVYAVGSAQAGNLAALVQTVSGLASAPAQVNAGSGGLADDGAAAGVWWAAAAATALVAATAGVALRRSR